MKLLNNCATICVIIQIVDSNRGMSSDMLPGVSNQNESSSNDLDNFNYITEIQDMMYGFGDSFLPLVESAQLIEEIVHQQMVSICYRAMDVAEMRGSKVIKVEDLLFLLRNNKIKLQRILKYLALKEMKRSMNSTLSEDTGMESAIDSRCNFGKNNSVVNFLLSIDQTGELEDLLFSAGFEAAWTGRAGDRDGITVKDGLSTPLFSPLVYFDAIKHDRSLRADEMASSMDKFSYLRFSEARRACFASAKSGGATRFWEWISNPRGKLRGWKRKRKASEKESGTIGNGDGIIEEDEQNEKGFFPQPAAMVIEVLSLLAFETVAQLVDLALFVRRDSAQSPEDRLMPPLYFNPNFPVYQEVTNGNKVDPRFRPYPRRNVIGSVPRISADAMVRCPQPLTPQEIQEAIRRYWSTCSIGPLSHFSREPGPSQTRRFLCC